jgi:hypothetical protein
VLYEVKVDRKNNGVEDLAYQLQFTTKIQSGTFLNFLGPVTNLTTDGSAVDNGKNVNPNGRHRPAPFPHRIPRVPPRTNGSGQGDRAKSNQ